MSRRFKIKTVIGQDDPACMKEVIYRRIMQSINNPNGGFGSLPDVIFVDGGITQINAGTEATKEAGVCIPIFGMVKNDKHQTRALLDENRNEIEISENLFKLITLFQDTVHDTAISYHRKLRDKAISKSELDNIKGIGDAKKKALIKAFGSVEKIKKASVEELCKVKGINKELAVNIKTL
jgi:excinuclease ABC subunit C